MFSIFRILPVGTGEITAARKIKEDKINKSIQRRYAATAAIEREKQRRALTESDREKMRLELYEKDQPDKDTEESFLFLTACQILELKRNSMNNQKEEVFDDFEVVPDPIILFQSLSDLISLRYPTSTKAAVCYNNLFLVTSEVNFMYFFSTFYLSSLRFLHFSFVFSCTHFSFYLNSFLT